MMKELLEILPKHKDFLDTLQGKLLYIIDWKDENDGGISFSNYDMGRPAVCLVNPHELAICCDKFPENALPVKKGCFSQQCECVLFPNDGFDDDSNWVLFVETKYAKDEQKARDERNKYPDKMVAQIEATVEYFRDRGILNSDKTVFAIVSFPMLDNNFNAWFDQNLIHEAWAGHRIIMRATNRAKILSKERINLL